MVKQMMIITVVALCVVMLATGAFAEYEETEHKKAEDLPKGAIQVTKPGKYAESGKTYVLMNDISSEGTPVYLGNNVTLDLNGYTITYADGKYEHLPNYSFEEGLKDWDTSKAPGAKVVSSSVRPMVGEKICELPEGQELISKYITLPVANRAYYAMCAVATDSMRVTINVDDEQGNPVDCKFQFGSKVRPACPEVRRPPKKGGGVVFALIFNKPAGKYRIRVKAERKNCLIDEVDIRPALDVGVGIVEKVYPWAYYKCIFDGDATAFFNIYKKEKELRIPIVKDGGTITIKNGVIKNGVVGIRSWGIQSTAKDALINLENIKVISSGINTNAVDIWGKVNIKNCRFEIDTPFIINRHNTSACSVKVGQASEIAHNEFIGGQGNLAIRGGSADIHNNLFVNNQTVTNHYSVSPGGKANKIYNNRFEPKQGSGIYVGGQDHEVYNNVFKISTAPPNCEYRYSDWSTNAIRMSDYNRDPGSDRGCFNNKVYNNKIFITGRAYPQYDRYIPLSYAFHYSCGGGKNYIYNNEIIVDHKDPKSNAVIAAFSMGGGDKGGGEWYNNKITSNVPPVWVGGLYGSARYEKIYNNTFVKAKNAAADMKPIKMGWWKYTATDIEFYSNKYEGFEFGVAEGGRGGHSYLKGWSLTVKLVDAGGKPVKGAEVVILDQEGNEAAKKKTDEKGLTGAMLAEHRVSGTQKTVCSSYTVKAGGKEEKIVLDKDTEITIKQ